MATAIAVVAPEAEAQCGHLSRTDVGKPDSGRQVCDDCKQIFQDGVPAPKIGQLLSDLATEAEVPTATKAAASRARKARKPKVGKAEGAKTINLTPDELARGKKADDEAARREYLRGVSDDASFLAVTMKGFAELCKTADEAIEARDEFFYEKMKTPAFADRVQRVRDFASTKHNNEVLTIDGKEYKSVKLFFKKELGVTYEYVRQLGKKLGRLNLLLEDGVSQPQGDAVNPPLPEIPEADVPETWQPVQPQIPEVTPVAEIVEAVVEFTVSRTRHLSAAEKEEFYDKLLDRLQAELQQPCIDFDVEEDGDVDGEEEEA